MSLANIDLNTILYFGAIVVVVIIVFGILSFVFKHLFHWFARGCGCVVFLLLAYFVVHVLLKLL